MSSAIGGALMHPAQIRAALAMAGYNQADLARELGLAPTTVSAVINGRGHSAQVEERVAAITGHTLEELWPQWHSNEKPLVLSNDERALILLLRDLPPASRDQVLPVVRAMVQDVLGNTPPPNLMRSAQTIKASGNARVVTASGGSIASGGGVHHHYGSKPKPKPKKK